MLPVPGQDARDRFVAYLRREFSEARTIIDALCNHLNWLGDPGEYQVVFMRIGQRMHTWNQVLQLQHYNSAADVLTALQQVRWMQQNSNSSNYVNSVLLSGPEIQGSGVEGSGSVQGGGLAEEGEEANLDLTVAEERHGSRNVDLENDSPSVQILPKKQNIAIVAITFEGTEIFDGKEVNVVDGMKVYEKLFDKSEVSKLVTLVNDLRASGTRGQFQASSKRPVEGHGGEMIQLGLPISDAPLEDESTPGTSKDRQIEPIPALLQDVIERLFASQVVTVKPDSCIIDIYNEGDHSQPHIWPHWYGRPVCVLFLTEFEMTFGKVIDVDHPGDYRGSLQLSLTPGSMLSMQGRSAYFAKHAIPSLPKQRILVTFVKADGKMLQKD